MRKTRQKLTTEHTFDLERELAAEAALADTPAAAAAAALGELDDAIASAGDVVGDPCCKKRKKPQEEKEKEKNENTAYSRSQQAPKIRTKELLHHIGTLNEQSVTTVRKKCSQSRRRLGEDGIGDLNVAPTKTDNRSKTLQEKTKGDYIYRLKNEKTCYVPNRLEYV